MALTAGAHLGPYEVLSQIGAGGMGEVYRARDTRLDRVVALKILPAALAADPHFRERFDREARAISQLTHPHICRLYDVGEHGGAAFLVMELIEGATLSDRLATGALPLADALRISIQIADALDAAHRHGIVHRDLKPGNVMLTRTGVGSTGAPQAKLLDFGLAKAGGIALANAAQSGLPTTPANLTAEGTILGTFQYMAPEQLEGQEADPRTDLFAFGAIVYEMLTGRKAFEGKSHASLVASIMGSHPPLVSQAQPLASPALDRIVARCLTKDRDDRWQTARDLMLELEWVASSKASTATSAPASWSRPLAWATAAAALALAIVALAAALRPRAAPVVVSAPSRFQLSDQLPISGDLVPTFAVSLDGRRVVYAAANDAGRRLYVRDLQTLDARPIAGTENGGGPFFSPEGTRLGFWADSALKIVDLDGGSPVTLVQHVDDPGRGAAWTRDDTIIYVPMTDGGLFRVSASGGTPEVLAKPDRGKLERGYRWPHVLPDGETVLFTVANADLDSFDDAPIVIRSLRTGEQRELLRGGGMPWYVHSGHLLYARAGTLQAVRFNAATKAVEGTARTVAEGLTTYPTTGAAQYAVSANGTLFFQPGTANVGRRSTLAWVDRAGRSTPIDVRPAPYGMPSISPDGRFAATGVDEGGNTVVWILELARNTLTRLTHEWNNVAPFWSPDGLRIAFASSRRDVIVSLFWQPTEGRADADPLTPGRVAYRGSFSPDGRTLAFAGPSSDTGFDIWTMATDGKQQAQSFVRTKFAENAPRFSPDGRWLAYVSTETGRPEVYAQPFPGPGRRVRLSTDGGTEPRWARDGREIFFQGGGAPMPTRASTGSVEAPLMGVKVNLNASDLAPQRAELLFTKATVNGFDVAADGRFLMIDRLESTATAAPITVVINWLEELKARMSTR